MIKLQIKEDGGIREFVSKASPIYVGRGEDPDENHHIYLRNPLVSRLHGQIELKEGEYWYRDVESKNGSTIRRGGPKILLGVGNPLQEHNLREGDEIFAGDSSLLVKEIKIEFVSLLREIEGQIQEKVSAYRGLQEFHTVEKSVTGNNKSLAAIYWLESQLLTAFDLDDLLEKIIDAVLAAFPSANCVFIALKTEDSGKLRLRLGKRKGMEAQAAVGNIISQSVFDRVVSAGQSIMFEDALTAFERASSVELSGIKCGMCAPLWHANRIIGMIEVDNRVITGCFTQSDLHLLTVFANRAAQAISCAVLQEEKNAAEINAQLGKRVRSIVHEMGNILGPLFQSVEMIGEQVLEIAPGDKSLRELFRAAQMDATRIQTFLGDLHDPNQAERPMNWGNVQLNDVAADVVAATKPAADRYGKSLEIQAAEDMPLIWADPERLRQVLLNLVKNSLEATKRGDHIWVNTVLSPDAATATLEVSDTGCGIPENKISKIFNAFESTKSRGTGLGLSVAKGIIEKLGGTISVKSKEGQGTTFTITLPVQGPVAESP